MINMEEIIRDLIKEVSLSLSDMAIERYFQTDSPRDYTLFYTDLEEKRRAGKIGFPSAPIISLTTLDGFSALYQLVATNLLGIDAIVFSTMEEGRFILYQEKPPTPIMVKDVVALMTILKSVFRSIKMFEEAVELLTRGGAPEDELITALRFTPSIVLIHSPSIEDISLLLWDRLVYKDVITFKDYAEAMKIKYGSYEDAFRALAAKSSYLGRFIPLLKSELEINERRQDEDKIGRILNFLKSDAMPPSGISEEDFIEVIYREPPEIEANLSLLSLEEAANIIHKKLIFKEKDKRGEWHTFFF